VGDPHRVADLERARLRHERSEDRKGWALYVFLVVICLAVAWGMWRLDDRSERMFELVAQSRPAGPPCP